MGVLGSSVSLLLVATGFVTIVAVLGYWSRSRGVVPSFRSGSSTDPQLEQRLERALGSSFSTSRAHLESPPSIRTVRRIDTRSGDESNVGSDQNRGRTDEQPVVPVVSLELGSTDTPGRDLVFGYVSEILEAIQPPLADEQVPVDRYEIEVRFGPDGLLVSRQCRRVSVPARLADRLLEDERYRPLDLRREVERAANETPSAVVWGECR